MKHLVHYFKDNYQPEITIMPELSLGIVVVIPCFNEPDLKASIECLARCARPCCAIEVIVVVNFGEQVDESVKKACCFNYKEAKELQAGLSVNNFTVHCILKEDLPHKHAGVGLARKTGMDEAAYRFMKLNRPEGLIFSFDADSVCDDNYFTAIEDHYKQYPGTQASSVYYEHPLGGHDFLDNVYSGIAQYELHLRYYNQALRFASLPFAYHTVGSSMVCTASAYAKIGGMNRRKAGEDFYFLQKLIPLGYFSEINTTRVIPSPRVSDRVPFGTGRAMMKYVDESQCEMQTYSLEAFLALKQMAVNLPSLYRSSKTKQKSLLHLLHPYLSLYLEGIEYYVAIDELNDNCADYPAFEKRFFRWFDAFRTLKFMNQVHNDGPWSKQTVTGEAVKLLSLLHVSPATPSNAVTLLEQYRQIERRRP
ncbi:MAG: hypothetical protein LBL90_05675 [Prevotellaceae bacterium]|jgi:glycosyltransferase involved in cell wall biosynthesis|nr:hypothetical protein [Prevotellaceae bacterium]